ncbi:MAG: hypothetical protein IPP83_02665 [Flavobacteriales bacterium]|nr:hypothetical protein [Flavobacteriales bacterium]MCC6937005.1 hypothetical protein [Flavobacteriales bacterium]
MLRFALLFIAMVSPMAAVLMAQPVGGPPPCWPPPCIPIDGGLTALIVAGLVYGGGKAARMRNVRGKSR